MSSIGPQLPPTSPKRKRSIDDEASATPSGRPNKSARSNDAEIKLDSDSEDDYGPAAPSAAKPSIGPSLPPTQASTNNQDEIDLDDSGDDDTGPAPPASQPKVAGPMLPSPDNTASAAPPPSARRVLGPSLPPADLSTRPADDPDSDSDSGSDYGPALPGSARSAQRSSAAQFQQSAASASASSSAPQRDSWMLAPGASSSGPDPTKLKARKFATGRAAGASAAAGGGGISSMWTETPEQKAKRLADAVLGRGGDPQQQQGPAAAAAAARNDSYSREQDAKVRAYTEATRGKSLYEEHQAARKEGKAEREGGRLGKDGEEEDDPSKRAFDKEKDMALGGRINHTQRRQLLNQAADFGGRFQKGKYL